MSPFAKHLLEADESNVELCLSLLGDILKQCEEFKIMMSDNPVINIYKQLFPIYKDILSKTTNIDIVEAVCRNIKHCMRAMDSEFSQFLVPFM